MPTLAEYQQKLPNREMYDTMTFSHPSFGDIRLVNRQYFPKTLGGIEYTPAGFEIDESQQTGTPVIDATIKFGRVQNDFKKQLKLWKGGSRLEPITATRRLFDSADRNTAVKEWTLFVKSVDMDADNVSCVLSVTNPLNNNIGRLYDPTEWTGLQNI